MEYLPFLERTQIFASLDIKNDSRQDKYQNYKQQKIRQQLYKNCALQKVKKILFTQQSHQELHSPKFLTKLLILEILWKNICFSLRIMMPTDTGKQYTFLTFLTQNSQNFFSKLQNYFLFNRQHHIPEKAMAPYSSTLAWKIPWMEEPGRLQSMGSLGVRHD